MVRTVVTNPRFLFPSERPGNVRYATICDPVAEGGQLVVHGLRFGDEIPAGALEAGNEYGRTLGSPD